MEHIGSKGAAPPRIRLCDSLGLGVPWTESPVPRSVPRMIHTICHALKLDASEVEFIGHNNLGMAMANSIAAMMHGSGGIACSFAGLGQRGGIASTEQMLIHLAGHYGVEPDLVPVKKVFDFLRSCDVSIAPDHPLWGDKALTRCQAPHGNAFSSTQDLGSPFDTVKLLDIDEQQEIWREAGAPGLIHLIRSEVPDAELDCEDEAVVGILNWLEEKGVDRANWEELEPLVREKLPALFEG